MKKELFNQYVSWVSDIFNMPKDIIFTKTKERNIVDARHLLFYLCYERGIPVVTIRQYLRENGLEIHHPSILHGIKKTKKKTIEDEDYSTIIKRIQKGVSI